MQDARPVVWNIVAHSPVTGLGPLTFSLPKPLYGTTFGLISANWILFSSIPHNGYLQMLVLMGQFRFVPFIMLLRKLFALTAVSAAAFVGAGAD